MLFTRVRSFCIQQSPIRQFQTLSSHYFSLNKSKKAKRPPAESVWKYRHKFGSDWTCYDLESYNISINNVDPLQFFGLQVGEGVSFFGRGSNHHLYQELPEPAVDEELLKFTDPDAMEQVHHAQLINLLDLAMTPQEPELETAVCDFSVKLLEVMGFVGRDRVARTRMDLPLFVSNEDAHAKTDICIIDRLSQDDVLLVLREGQHGTIRARAQLIADGVAAFYLNNYHRENVRLPYLENKVNYFIIP